MNTTFAQMRKFSLEIQCFKWKFLNWKIQYLKWRILWTHLIKCWRWELKGSVNSVTTPQKADFIVLPFTDIAHLINWRFVVTLYWASLLVPFFQWHLLTTYLCQFLVILIFQAFSLLLYLIYHIWWPVNTDHWYYHFNYLGVPCIVSM